MTPSIPDQLDPLPPRADGVPTVSAYVIAFNEEHKIEAAIASVLWADEVILVDSHSTDRTAEIAESLGARVVQVDFEGFGKLRQSAIAACRGDWIFSLDADERCTAEARDEILRIVADEASADVWRTPRRNWLMGRWIRFSGWHPDFRQPQLFRRGSMTYDDLPVHEGWIATDGATIDVMRSSIRQVPFREMGELLHKANRYSALGADKLEARGTRGSMWLALVHGFASFFKHLVLKLGFLDGWAGFMIAFSAGEGAFYKHAKLWERRRGWELPPAERLERPSSPGERGAPS